MSGRTISPLAAGYEAEFDVVDEPAWCQLLQRFADGNIYQTWACASLAGGHSILSHLVLKRDGNVVAIALAKVRKLPILGVGITSIFMGPLWRLAGEEVDVEIFRQAMRALRNEFVCNQKSHLRLYPSIFDDDSLGLCDVLREEGFLLEAEEGRSKTLLMDLSPSLEDLNDALSPMWKRNLKTARKNNLDFVEGTSAAMFDDFISIYKEMKNRKGFEDAVDVLLYQKMQALLPESLKMRVMLCKSETTVCSGLIYSRIGNTAIYLFGATGNKGRQSCGSYALQWNLVEALKKEGTAIYDLNGINQEVNPGTYRFKNDFAGKHGRHVRYVGRFDAHGEWFANTVIQLADALRTVYRWLRQRLDRK